uniref:Uncharacterized protein n=1 Tax=Siphoviridae sp. ctOVO10 TaxID=2826311 RepID=A0A8S5M3B6_9CAUD|nr:MAG TPA: hypothetical protein [Siphoviridae sp. ctOVO10]
MSFNVVFMVFVLLFWFNVVCSCLCLYYTINRVVCQ